MLGHIDLVKRKPAQGVAPALGQFANEPPIREALQCLTREQKWIDDIHLQVCRIPAPTFLEARRAEWVASQLRSLGWDARLDKGGNVVALLGADRGHPLVALTAHLDTVLAPASPEDIKVDARGRFLGPGVSDNGSGLAALLAVARAFASVPPLRPDQRAGILLVANVCEEGEGNLNGMRHLCIKPPYADRIGAFVILDGPSIDHITAEALACRRFEITVQGPGGHSWSDHGVPNPVHALSRIVSQYCEAMAELADRGPKYSYNFGVFEGGSSINAIPSLAQVKVDLRSEEPAFLDAIAAQVSTVTHHVIQAENLRSQLGRLTAKVREAGSRPGGALDPSSSLLETVRSVDSYLGISSHMDCASTDANLPLSMGLNALSIGAGGQGGGAHTPGEWYHPEGRDLGLRRIYLVVSLMLEKLSAHT